MFNPFKKAYSLESYKEQEEKVGELNELAKNNRGEYVEEKHDSLEAIGTFSEAVAYRNRPYTEEVWVPSRDQKNYEKAKKILTSMFESGRSEATKLNEKYDSLLRKMDEAQKELFEFEKEKLEMHQEK